MAASYKDLYLSTLLDNVILFWQKHSIDRQAGGFFSCLDRDGQVYEYDKFIWLQARQVWTFAMLYNRYERRSAWLDIACHGADFLRTYGLDENGNWYFALDRLGRPLARPTPAQCTVNLDPMADHSTIWLRYGSFAVCRALSVLFQYIHAVSLSAL